VKSVPGDGRGKCTIPTYKGLLRKSFNILNCRFFMSFSIILLSAAATGASVATGNSVAADMIKGISDEAQQEVAEKQDYSISVKKDIGIQIYVVKRVEY